MTSTRGVGIGSDGSIGFGEASSTTTTVSALGQSVAPPAAPAEGSIGIVAVLVASVGVVGAVGCFASSYNPDYAYTWRTPFIVCSVIAASGLALGVFTLRRSSRARVTQLPTYHAQMRAYERMWLCLQCGHRFVLTEDQPAPNHDPAPRPPGASSPEGRSAPEAVAPGIVDMQAIDDEALRRFRQAGRSGVRSRS